MNCDDINKQLNLMLDDALDQKTELAIKAHLSFCPTCKSQWEQLNGLRSLLQRVDTSAPTKFLESRVMSAFYKKHASGKPVRTTWSFFPLLLGTSKPVFTMSVMAVMTAVMMAALAVAFALGRLTATEIVVAAQPTFTASSANPLPSTPPESGVERWERAPFQVRAMRICSRRPAIRTNAESIPRKPSVAPIESFTSVSPQGTSYSTRASLHGFEPMKNTKVRVIRGEEEK